MKPKLENSRVWLHKRFVIEGKKPEEMAKEAGCSALTIRRRLKEKGIISDD